MHPNIYKEFYPERRNICELVTQPSCTKPGLAMSMRTVVEKYVKGTLQLKEKTPIYEPYYDENNPNPLRKPNVDLTDIAAHSNYLKSQYEQMCNQHSQLKHHLSTISSSVEKEEVPAT